MRNNRGPNWIHASGSPGHPNPILQAATETNTPLHHWNDKQLIYDSSGEALDHDETDKLSTILWDIIDEAFVFSANARQADQTSASIPEKDSLYDYISRKALERLPDDHEREILLRMSEMFGAYVGEPVWAQSLRFAWLEECCGGGEHIISVQAKLSGLIENPDEVFVESNYARILERIAQPARSSAEIRLSSYIKSILTPTSRATDSQVTLISGDEEPMVFDEVVVTAPLGWLKQHHSDVFSPRLPPPVCAAIEHISLSHLEKVFITFPAVFWTQNNPDSGEFPAYANWLRPTYAPGTNPQGWPQEIWDLSALAPPNRHPTILFYIYGDCSRHIVSNISSMSTEEEFRFLDDFFRPYYSRLPGYDASSENCRPRAILASRWQADPLSGNASYCNFQVGIESADKDVTVLRDGCPDRRLWFCGEHAAPFEECGTVAGAYLSGEATGMKILGVYGRL